MKVMKGPPKRPCSNESIPSVANVLPERSCSNESIDLNDLPKDPTYKTVKNIK